MIKQYLVTVEIDESEIDESRGTHDDTFAVLLEALDSYEDANIAQASITEFSVKGLK